MTSNALAVRRAKRWRSEKVKVKVKDLVEPQPTPIMATLAVTPDRQWTSIVRYWKPGDIDRCRLCPVGTCVGRLNVCHLIFSGVIDDREALLVSSVGLSRVVQRGPRAATQV